MACSPCCFWGLLAEDKGIYDLLDVIARHKTEFAGRLQLLIGGNGDAERVKNFIAQHGLIDIIKFAGVGERREKIAVV
jgi:glycosyltransferase involved in cell wall biosynthesis